MSFSNKDKVLTHLQLHFLNYHRIRSILLNDNKDYFDIFFTYNNIKCKLEFIEKNENGRVFLFKDKQNTFEYKIEVDKLSKFDTIDRVIESAVLKICFNDLTF